MTIQRNLNSWVNGDANREAVRRTIDEMSSRLTRLEQTLAMLTKNTAINGSGSSSGLNAQQRSDVAGLIGALSQGVIGQSTPDPVLPGQIGGGTVVSVTAGNGLSGGTISTSGTVALLIGAANAIQKSNGTRLVDSQITDDGTSVVIASAVGRIFNVGGGDASGFVAQGNSSFVGDWNGAGNGTYLEVRDALAGLFILRNLPVADPGVSGALWNNAGVINVSP